jgi:hypothetical protein
MASPSPSPGIAFPGSLDQVKIASLPETAYYVPEFLSDTEERAILDKVRLLVAASVWP